MGASVAAGDVYVICHGSSDSLIRAECDEFHSYLSNGDDGYALVKGTETDFEVVDVLGQSIFDTTYSDPGSAWSVAGVSGATKDAVLVRKAFVQTGNTNWAESAGTSADDSEWVVLEYDSSGVDPTPGIGSGGFEADNWSGLGSHEIDQQEEEGPYLAEGFEGDVFPPSGWDMVSYDEYGYAITNGWGLSDGTSGFPYYGPGSPNSGAGAAYFDVYDYWYDDQSTLISPPVDLSGASAPKLSFYVWDPYHSSSYGYALEVSISTDAGVSFGAPVFTTLGTDGWEKIEVDLSSYVGQSIHVAFKSTSDYGSSNPHLDDISIAEPPTYQLQSFYRDS